MALHTNHSIRWPSGNQEGMIVALLTGYVAKANKNRTRKRKTKIGLNKTQGTQTRLNTILNKTQTN
jgi:hypothetical protein